MRAFILSWSWQPRHFAGTIDLSPSWHVLHDTSLSRLAWLVDSSPGDDLRKSELCARAVRPPRMAIATTTNARRCDFTIGSQVEGNAELDQLRGVDAVCGGDARHPHRAAGPLRRGTAEIER